MDLKHDPFLVQQTRERLAKLLLDTLQERQTSKEHLQQVIEELSTGLEELLVAEEELRVQADELAASSIAIDAERERYGELFEFAPDAYLVTDGKGRILEANSSAADMLGVPARFLDGKLLVSFVSDPARRDLRNLLNELVDVGEPVHQQVLQVEPRDGVAFEAEVRAVSKAASPTGDIEIRWMVRDITKRLELEEEVRFLHSEVDLLKSLGQVARLTASPQPAETLLDRVAQLSTQALPGCEVSVAIAGPDGVRFLCPSGDRARRLDDVAQAHGDGPCLSAIGDDRLVDVTRDQCRTRWPAFGAVADEVELTCAIGHPLSSTGNRRGVLNVYAFRPLTDDERSLIPLLADQVVVALDNLDLYESAHTLASHLERALESRGVIEQAKGILMARQGCTDDEAFDMLRRASQRMNRKLRDVASDLVTQVRSNTPRRPPPPGPPVDREAAAARAALLEGQARARSAVAQERADVARLAGRERLSDMHQRASGVHERAADLQRRHQTEMESDQTAAPAE